MFTINGPPARPFHGELVKAEVHARLADRGARPLHAAAGRDPGPARRVEEENLHQPALLRALGRRRRRRGPARPELAPRLQPATARRSTRAIEPEADGALADGDDVDPLVAGRARERDRVRDASHTGAVAYEDARGPYEGRRRRGHPVGKVQSSAGAYRAGDGARAARLPFADPIYLHQVTERGTNRSVPDLPEALADDRGGRGGASTSTCRSSSRATGSAAHAASISSGAYRGGARRMRSRPTPGTGSARR